MPYRRAKLWGNIKPPPGSTVDWGDHINDDLVGCWPFSEGCGTVVSDIAARNNAALVSGTTWSPVPNSKVVGNAPLFNGSTLWADAGDKPPFRLTGAMTLCAWCRGTPIGNTGLFGKIGSSGSRGFSMGPNGSTVTFFVASNSTTLVTTTGGTHTTADVWFYAATYVPSTYCAIYQNGVQIALNTTSIPASQFSANSIPLRIGDRGDGIGQFSGRAWNARIYARALTQAEIQRLFWEPFAGIVAPRRRIISAVAAGGGAVQNRLTLLGVG